jgi:hypothetical protein
MVKNVQLHGAPLWAWFNPDDLNNFKSSPGFAGVAVKV